MGADADLDWTRAAASALEWWHDAGVDTLIDEAPRDWFAVPAVVAKSVAAGAPVAAAAASVPSDLPGFLAWRAGPDAPEAAWHGPLLTPSGPVDAAVMVLLDCPDLGEGPGELLAEGPAARLFARMLAAIGLDRSRVHLAATYWRRPPPGRIAPETEERLHDLARRHVALARPRRVLVMGDAASRALTGASTVAARGSLRALNHDAGETEVVASFHPRLLLDRPAAKAEAWKDLQLLVKGLDA